jgi:HSP20 family protein
MNTVVRLHNRLNNRHDHANLPYPDRLDDLFAGLFRPVTESSQAPESLRLEVSEDDKAYRVSAAIAGAKKDEIQIAVDKNEVSISVEIKREAVAKEGERLLHSERYYGKSSRAFSLAQEINEDGVEASYADGVLRLVLPKKAPAAAKRITIA